MTRNRRKLIIRAVAAVAAIGVVAKWRPILFYLFYFVGLGSVALFFEQDFHPWEESMGDLAAFAFDSDVLENTTELKTKAEAFQDKEINCAAFDGLHQQGTFRVEAQTLCKIRIRTNCPCAKGSLIHDGRWPATWTMIHVSRGPNKAREGWVCVSDVRLTVTPL